MIAEQIGHGCTRSAVSGKVDRLGLGARIPRKDRVVKPRIPKQVTEDVVAKEVSHAPEEPQSFRISMMHIRDGECKWIGDDPQIDSSMCGHPTIPNKSYCSWHYGRSFQPAQKILRETDAQ